MKAIDLEKERSEKRLSIGQFEKLYNENLPTGFPRATLLRLKEFRKTFPALFKGVNPWSLEQHRKKLMDWLPQYTRSLRR